MKNGKIYFEVDKTQSGTFRKPELRVLKKISERC